MTNTHELIAQTNTLTDAETKTLIAFLIGYSPKAVIAALELVAKDRAANS